MKFVSNPPNSKYQCEKCYFPYVLDSSFDCKTVRECLTDATKIAVYNPAIIATGALAPFVVTFDPSGTCSTFSGFAPGFTNADCAAVTQISVISITNPDKGNLACSQCKEGFAPVIDFGNFDQFPYDPFGNSEKVYSPLSGYPIIFKCVATASGKVKGNVNLSTNTIANCKYYALVTGADTIGCVRCNYGFTGKVMQNTDGSPVLNGFITSCIPMADCDTSVSEDYSAGVANGSLDTTGVLTKFFSCYRCITPGNIPFFFGHKADLDAKINDLKPFYQNSTQATYATTPFESGGTEGNVVQCGPTSNSGVLKISNFIKVDLPASPADKLPDNCSLAIVNVSSDRDATEIAIEPIVAGSKIATFCVSCKPGYAPKYSTNTGQKIVTACELIANCNITSNNTWMNSCQNCVHYYDVINNKVMYEKCVANSADNTVNSTNCFSAETNSQCVICTPGYSLRNNVCVIDLIPNCQVAGIVNDFQRIWGNQYLKSGGNTLWYLRSSDVGTITGCVKCSADFTLAKVDMTTGDPNVKEEICTNTSLNPAASTLTPNCSNYRIKPSTTTIVCAQCDVGYIITVDYLCTPVNNVTLPFCILANEMNGTFCSACVSSTYTNIAGVCSIPNIPNCLKYLDSMYEPYAKCESCLPGYARSSTFYACNLITNNIDNCSAIDVSNVCTSCFEKFVLVTSGPGGSHYCFPVGTGALSVASDPNCLVLDDAKFILGNIECKTCAPGFLPIISLGYTTGQPGNTSPFNYCYPFGVTQITGCDSYDAADLTKSLKCLSCAPISNLYYNPATATCIVRTVIVNCLTYNPNSDQCSVCNPNFSLTTNGKFCLPVPGVSSNLGGIPNSAYYQNCSQNNDCSSTFYQGLPSILNSITSCHVCKNSGNIPVISVKTDNGFIIGIQGYSFAPATGFNYDTGFGGFSNACLPPVASTFNIPSTNFNFPKNCALAILNANSVPDASSSNLATNVIPSKTSIMCVACPPGYKATPGYDTTGKVVPLMVSSCNQIANCESSTWFNQCSQCNPNFSYLYTLGVGISYDICVSYPSNPNCLAVDINNVCWNCQRAYYLNKDGYCELIQPPRCSTAEFRFNLPYQIHDLATGLILSIDGVGCQTCDAGFVGLYASTVVTACTQSPYHFNNMVTPTSKYIFGCQNYEANNGDRMRCTICSTGYVLTRSGICVSNAKISNCILAETNAYCRQCAPQFINISRKCVPVTISNCLSFYFDIHLNEQICQVCAPNYYLENNVCIQGTIQFCAEYSTRITCNRCQPGYALTTIKNIISYCYPIMTDMNCSSLDLNLFWLGTISCSSCISNNFIISKDPIDFYTTRCMPFIQIDYCSNYTFTNQIAGSTLACSQCDSIHFLNITTGSCVPRTKTVTNCQVYNSSSDQCLTCNTGYFIDNNNYQVCNSQPNGIWGCIAYTDEKTCSQCDDGFYFQDSNCQAIPNGQRIIGCLYYQSLTQCIQCQRNYFLTENTCIPVFATNCATYLNPNACATCPSGYGFSISNQIISCSLKNTPNCLSSSDIPPYACLDCISGFYPLNGTCTPVTKALNGCNSYLSNDGSCSSCNSGFILNPNNTCISNLGYTNIDQNCINYAVSTSPICNSCAPGSYFLNNACVQCMNNTLDSGCLSCDPNDNNICLACTSGYFQNSAGKCSLNPVDQSNSTNTNNTTNSTIANITNNSNSTTQFASIQRLFMILALMLALFN